MQTPKLGNLILFNPKPQRQRSFMAASAPGFAKISGRVRRRPEIGAGLQDLEICRLQDPSGSESGSPDDMTCNGSAMCLSILL